MAIKNITEILPGDVIVEGSNRMTVTKIELNRCANHVHINESDCYHNVVDVRVQDSK